MFPRIVSDPISVLYDTSISTTCTTCFTKKYVSTFYKKKISAVFQTDESFFHLKKREHSGTFPSFSSALFFPASFLGFFFFFSFDEVYRGEERDSISPDETADGNDSSNDRVITSIRAAHWNSNEISRGSVSVKNCNFCLSRANRFSGKRTILIGCVYRPGRESFSSRNQNNGFHPFTSPGNVSDVSRQQFLPIHCRFLLPS